MNGVAIRASAKEVQQRAARRHVRDYYQGPDLGYIEAQAQFHRVLDNFSLGY